MYNNAAYTLHYTCILHEDIQDKMCGVLIAKKWLDITHVCRCAVVFISHTERHAHTDAYTDTHMHRHTDTHTHTRAHAHTHKHSPLENKSKSLLYSDTGLWKA